MKHIPILSFFSGGGFLDIGFEKAGFNVVWTNEINPDFAELYRHGMSSWRKSRGGSLIEISEIGSIKRVDGEQIRNKVLCGKKQMFGVIGGPPCPDFSVGGKQKGKTGDHGQLSWVYAKKICEIEPSFFVFENVPGLYRTKIHREFLLEIEHEFEEADYNIDIRILNALECGCPQDRERLFVVGVKRGIVRKQLGRMVPREERGWFPWHKLKFPDAKKKYKWPDTNLFGAKPLKPENIPYELMIDSIFGSKNPPQEIVNGQEAFKAYSKKFFSILEGDTSRKSFKRLHRYRFSPTACYGNNEVHLHPWEKRRLSVREALRIQGVPDEYVLPEDFSLTKKFKLIGNGVPVPLAYEVATSLRMFLKM
ncbi:MAG: DNA cytosine methyltransferase [Candidatus Omnitrophota bacterium]